LESAEGGPWLVGDWQDAVFLHYRVDPKRLRPLVPCDLDLYEGGAYVSLALATLTNLRLNTGERLVPWPGGPGARHGVVHVRTYIRHAHYPAEAGTFLLAEWLSNPASRLLGREIYGLPYRPVSLDYRQGPPAHALAGTVTDPAGASLRYAGTCAGGHGTSLRNGPRTCPRGSLDEFLLERYTAFTRCGAIDRMYRLWHQPWRQQAIDLTVEDRGLLAATGPWLVDARRAGAHYSAGVSDAWIGRPTCIQGAACTVPWSGKSFGGGEVGASR
jgi:uncharacterized protein YqjF (DUF2071 family)